jgi:hypothetical protein
MKKSNFQPSFLFYSKQAGMCSVGIAVLVCTLFLACIKKDLEDLKVESWQPEVALPVISSHFTVTDIVNKFETGGYLSTDASDLITVVYTGELFSLYAKDVMKLSEVPFFFADTSITLALRQLQGAKLKSMVLNEGVLAYEIRAEHTSDVLVEVEIPKATRGGQSFKEVIEIPYTGNNQLYQKGSLSLAGVVFDLSGESGVGANELKMRYKSKDKSSGLTVQLAAFQGRLKELHYELLKGYLGRYDFGAQNDSMRLDLFKNYQSGTLFLDEPRIKISIANSFGIPTVATFTNFSGNNPNTGFNLSGSFFSEVIDVKHPSDPGANATVITQRTVDKSNSNIQNFLAISPHRVSYGFEMGVNVDADTTALNFVTGSSKLQGDLTMEIPLQGRIDHIVLTDTFAVAFDEVDEAERVQFKLLINNAFPFNAQVQLYFLDTLGQRMDSLMGADEQLFAHPPIDAEGIVRVPVLETTIFEMSQSKFQVVKGSRKMVLRVQLLSHEQGSKTVKFLSSNFMDIKLGVMAKLNVKPKK